MSKTLERVQNIHNDCVCVCSVCVCVCVCVCVFGVCEVVGGDQMASL